MSEQPRKSMKRKSESVEKKNRKKRKQKHQNVPFGIEKIIESKQQQQHIERVSSIHILNAQNEDDLIQCYQSIGLNPEFYPKAHQLEGVKFMLDREQKYGCSLLADEMGLGKSLQAHLLICFSKTQPSQSLSINNDDDAMQLDDSGSSTTTTTTTSTIHHPLFSSLTTGRVHRGTGGSLVVTPKNVSDCFVAETLKYFQPWAQPSIAQYQGQGKWNVYERRKDRIGTQQRLNCLLKEKDLQHFDIIIMRHQSLTSLFQRQPDHFIFSHVHERVVVDEVHRMRNSNTLLAQVCKRLQARFRLAISGTPRINRDEDVWSIFDFLRIPKLPTLTEFRKILKTPETADRLVEEWFRLYMHRVTKQDLRDQDMDIVMKEEQQALERNEPVPERPEWCTIQEYKGEVCIVPPSKTLPVGIYRQDIHVPMGPCLRSMYQQIAEYTKAQLQEMSSRDLEYRTSLLASISYLRQLTCSPQAFFNEQHHKLKMLPVCGIEAIQRILIEEPSAKMDAMLNYNQQRVQSNEKVMIFCDFLEGCKEVCRHLRQLGKRVSEIHGGTNANVRTKTLAAFQKGTVESQQEDAPQYLVCTPCVQDGVPLTGVNHVWFMTIWWHSAIEEQMYSRGHRFGQDRDVHVVYFLMDTSIDLRIQEIARAKKGTPSTKQMFSLL